MCAPPVFRAHSRTVPVLLALPLALLALAACRSAAPPAAPEPEPPPVIVETTPAPAPAPPPPPVVKVTGSSLNVRREPSTRAAVVGKAKRGERLEVLDDGGDWLRVRQAGGTEGWVAARYVARDEPCLPDKATAEVVDTPILSFVEGAPRGTVTVEGEVDPAGMVVKTTVTANSTGSEAAAVVATRELEQMRFAPPVRRCKPVRFIYVYTRTF